MSPQKIIYFKGGAIHYIHVVGTELDLEKVRDADIVCMLTNDGQIWWKRDPTVVPDTRLITNPPKELQLIMTLLL